MYLYNISLSISLYVYMYTSISPVQCMAWPPAARRAAAAWSCYIYKVSIYLSIYRCVWTYTGLTPISIYIYLHVSLSPSLSIYIDLTCAMYSLAARRTSRRSGLPSLYIEGIYLSTYLPTYISIDLSISLCKDSQQGGTLKGNLSAARLNRFLDSWLSCRGTH